jgi:hypothetical protein
VILDLYIDPSNFVGTKYISVLYSFFTTPYRRVENTRVAFVPPNPKLFDRATFTGLSWACNGTKLNPASTSGSYRFAVGGTMFWCG